MESKREERIREEGEQRREDFSSESQESCPFVLIFPISIALDPTLPNEHSPVHCLLAD